VEKTLSFVLEKHRLTLCTAGRKTGRERGQVRFSLKPDLTPFSQAKGWPRADRGVGKVVKIEQEATEGTEKGPFSVFSVASCSTLNPGFLD
jgi:hypothetical protein